jgi:HK97 family phage prohead protease
MNKEEKKMPLIRYKSIEVKEPVINEDSRKVSGYLASFNNIDDVSDVLLKGCFAKSLQEHGVGSSSKRKIAFCYQHKTDTPIGRFTKLVEDEKGLYFEAELDDIPLVRDTIIPQYKSGTLNQHSIGFRYINADWKEKNNTEYYEVKEVELFEGSVVTMGCNEETPFLGFKNLTQSDISTIQKDIDGMKSISKDDRIKLKKIFTTLTCEAKGTHQEPPESSQEPKVNNLNDFLNSKN